MQFNFNVDIAGHLRDGIMNRRPSETATTKAATLGKATVPIQLPKSQPPSKTASPSPPKNSTTGPSPSPPPTGSSEKPEIFSESPPVEPANIATAAKEKGRGRGRGRGGRKKAEPTAPSQEPVQKKPATRAKATPKASPKASPEASPQARAQAILMPIQSEPNKTPTKQRMSMKRPSANLNDQTKETTPATVSHAKESATSNSKRLKTGETSYVTSSGWQVA